MNKLDRMIKIDEEWGFLMKWWRTKVEMKQL